MSDTSKDFVNVRAARGRTRIADIAMRYGIKLTPKYGVAPIESVDKPTWTVSQTDNTSIGDAIAVYYGCTPIGEVVVYGPQPVDTTPWPIGIPYPPPPLPNPTPQITWYPSPETESEKKLDRIIALLEQLIELQTRKQRRSRKARSNIRPTVLSKMLPMDPEND